MDALQEENENLKKEIRNLVVEKSRMEDQLYRAFRRVLNSKKRKINELQQVIEKMKNDRNNNDNGKRTKKEIKRIFNVSSDEDEEEKEVKSLKSDSDTDIDDAEILDLVPSKDSPRKSSPVKVITPPTKDKITKSTDNVSPSMMDDSGEDSDSLLK